MADPEPLRVPLQFRRALTALAQVEQDDYNKFLRTADELTSRPEIEVLKRAGRLAIGDGLATELAYALLSIFTIRPGLESVDPSIPRSISESEDLQLNEEQRVRLRERLADIAGIEEVALLGRAQSVLTDDPALFTTARIISNLRPVFRRDDPNQVSGIGIVRTLVIEFFDSSNQQTKTLHISVDDRDLELLSSVLEREAVKTEAVQSLVNRSEIRMLDIS